MEIGGHGIESFWSLLAGVPYIIAILISMKYPEVRMRAFKMVLIYFPVTGILSVAILLTGIFSDIYLTQIIQPLQVSVFGWLWAFLMFNFLHSLEVTKFVKEMREKMKE